ncbi:MAG: hypothetical protein H7Y32_09545 [Chloroflexales bacterium]|nr:hypothetical protein [Chloroflexales bacterium]
MGKNTERANALPAEQAPDRPVAASQPAAARFLDRLVSQLSPHAAKQGREDAILCGRWLLLRRIDAGLSQAALAARASLSAETLLFLEAGLADPALASALTWQRLAAVLGATRHDQQAVAQVISVALGGACGDWRVVERVKADLNAAYRVRHPPPSRANRREFHTMGRRTCHAQTHARE